MEEILSQSAVVKRGIIIAYYFSNIWYGKGLLGNRTAPDPNDTDPIEHPTPDLDEIDPNEEEDINYKHQDLTEENHNKRRGRKKSYCADDVENPIIPKDTD